MMDELDKEIALLEGSLNNELRMNSRQSKICTMNRDVDHIQVRDQHHSLSGKDLASSLRNSLTSRSMAVGALQFFIPVPSHVCQASGTGCQDAATNPAKGVWRTRWQKGGPMESSCILELGKRQQLGDLYLQIIFSDKTCLPECLRLYTGSKITGPFTPTCSELNLPARTKHCLNLPARGISQRFIKLVFTGIQTHGQGLHSVDMLSVCQLSGDRGTAASSKLGIVEKSLEESSENDLQLSKLALSNELDHARCSTVRSLHHRNRSIEIFTPITEKSEMILSSSPTPVSSSGSSGDIYGTDHVTSSSACCLASPCASDMGASKTCTPGHEEFSSKPYQMDHNGYKAALEHAKVAAAQVQGVPLGEGAQALVRATLQNCHSHEQDLWGLKSSVKEHGAKIGPAHPLTNLEEPSVPSSPMPTGNRYHIPPGSSSLLSLANAASAAGSVRLPSVLTTPKRPLHHSGPLASLAGVAKTPQRYSGSSLHDTTGFIVAKPTMIEGATVVSAVPSATFVAACQERQGGGMDSPLSCKQSNVPTDQIPSLAKNSIIPSLAENSMSSPEPLPRPRTHMMPLSSSFAVSQQLEQQNVSEELPESYAKTEPLDDSGVAKEVHSLPLGLPPPSTFDSTLKDSSPSYCEPSSGDVALLSEQDQCMRQTPTSSPVPSGPMVKVYWSKLPTLEAKDTVWSKLNTLEADIDYKALAEQFAESEPTSSNSSRTMSSRTGVLSNGSWHNESKKATMLFSLQRNHDIDVLLANLQLSSAQVCAAVEALVNTGICSLLSEEQVDAIAKILPNSDECKILAGYTGNLEDLQPAEQLLHGLMQLPVLEEKLACMKFVNSFQLRVEAISQAAKILHGSCNEVCNNELLHLILKISLIIGNFLNTGDVQDRAIGFQLDTLLKLKDVKSTRNKKVTLMHFIAREVKRLHPKSYNLKDQLKLCPSAMKLNLTRTKDDMRELKSGLKEVESMLKGWHGLSEDSKSGLVFERKGELEALLASFCAQAKNETAVVEQALEAAESTFSHVTGYLGGLGNKMEVTQFFELVNDFAKNLEISHLDNMAIDAEVNRKGKASTLSKSRIAPKSQILGLHQSMIHEQGADLGRAMRSVLSMHFDTDEMVRLSTPKDLTQAMQVATMPSSRTQIKGLPQSTSRQMMRAQASLGRVHVSAQKSMKVSSLITVRLRQSRHQLSVASSQHSNVKIRLPSVQPSEAGMTEFENHASHQEEVVVPSVSVDYIPPEDEVPPSNVVSISPTTDHLTFTHIAPQQMQMMDDLKHYEVMRVSMEDEMGLAAASAQSAVIDAIRNIASFFGSGHGNDIQGAEDKSTEDVEEVNVPELKTRQSSVGLAGRSAPMDILASPGSPPQAATVGSNLSDWYLNQLKDSRILSSLGGADDDVHSRVSGEEGCRSGSSVPLTKSEESIAMDSDGQAYNSGALGADLNSIREADLSWLSNQEVENRMLVPSTEAHHPITPPPGLGMNLLMARGAHGYAVMDLDTDELEASDQALEVQAPSLVNVPKLLRSSPTLTPDWMLLKQQHEAGQHTPTMVHHENLPQGTMKSSGTFFLVPVEPASGIDPRNVIMELAQAHEVLSPCRGALHQRELHSEFLDVKSGQLSLGQDHLLNNSKSGLVRGTNQSTTTLLSDLPSALMSWSTAADMTQNLSVNSMLQLLKTPPPGHKASQQEPFGLTSTPATGTPPALWSCKTQGEAPCSSLSSHPLELGSWEEEEEEELGGSSIVRVLDKIDLHQLNDDEVRHEARNPQGNMELGQTEQPSREQKEQNTDEPLRLVTPLRLLNTRPGQAHIGPLRRGLLLRQAGTLPRKTTEPGTSRQQPFVGPLAHALKQRVLEQEQRTRLGKSGWAETSELHRALQHQKAPQTRQQKTRARLAEVRSVPIQKSKAAYPEAIIPVRSSGPAGPQLQSALPQKMPLHNALAWLPMGQRHQDSLSIRRRTAGDFEQRPPAETQATDAPLVGGGVRGRYTADDVPSLVQPQSHDTFESVTGDQLKYKTFLSQWSIKKSPRDPLLEDPGTPRTSDGQSQASTQVGPDTQQRWTQAEVRRMEVLLRSLNPLASNVQED